MKIREDIIKQISLVIGLIMPFVGYSQLMTIDNSAPYDSPQYLVQNVLLGEGVTMSNFQFIGDSAVQIGFFRDNSGDIGIDSGIVMSTGSVQAIGAENLSGNTGSNLSGSNDPDLSQLAGDNVRDRAVIEFDFLPQGNNISFKYAFGSEEYPEWVASINDVFGFFISGPGISGPYTNGGITFPGAENIAVLPNSNVPVSIQSINVASNSQFYVSNGGNFDGSATPGTTTLEFDAYTTVLEAVFDSLICGETYHIKLAIGDASDFIFDSGVFLQARSFSSEGIDISLSTGTTSLDDDSTIVEGCTQAIFNLSRPDTTGIDTILVQVGGNAVMGVDYVAVPDTLYINAGDTAVELIIDPIDDGVVEGQDTVTLSIQRITPCGDTITTQGSVYIKEDYEINVTHNSALSYCPGNPIDVQASASNGIPDFTYNWSNGDVGEMIQVSPSQTDTLILTTVDSCQIESVDTVIVTVEVPDLTFDLSNDTTINCAGDPAVLGVTNVAGGTVPFSYTWSTGEVNAQILTNADSTTLYTVTVEDACTTTPALPKVDSVLVSVPIYSPISVTLTEDTVACSGDLGTVQVNASGGATPLNYVWVDLSSGNQFQASPISTSTYSVTVTDFCNVVEDTVATIYVTEYDSLTVSISSSGEIICAGDGKQLGFSAVGGATFQDYMIRWQHNGDSIGSDSLVLVTIDETGEYDVIITDACGTSSFDTITVVLPIYDPVEVTSVDSIYSCLDDTIQLTATPVGGSGNYSYQWSGSSFINLPDSLSTSAVAKEDVTYTILVTDECGTEGTTDIEIGIEDCSIIIPNVFTPNGDGLNELFHISNLDRYFSNELVIYNRWGTKVFEANNYKNDWDGDNHPDGVYFYLLNVEEENFQGSFTIIR